MENIPLSEAKNRLDELIERAARGEDVRIADPKHGTVRLQPVAQPPDAIEPPFPPRIAGQWKGRFKVPERLFEPLTEEELSWLSGEQST